MNHGVGSSNTWQMPVPLVFRICLAIYFPRILLNDGKNTNIF